MTNCFHFKLRWGKELKIKPNRKAARAAKGLTEFETETAYALSLIKRGYFSTRIITTQKGQMIRKSGLMEFWEPAAIEDVGGLGSLKSFIANRARAFSPENETLPRPKGVLLVGIPGTGKSLSCKQGNHFSLLWDSYHTGGLEKRIGKDAGILKQAYSVQRIRREARIKGYRVVQKKVTNGIRLVLSF